MKTFFTVMLTVAAIGFVAPATADSRSGQFLENAVGVFALGFFGVDYKPEIRTHSARTYCARAKHRLNTASARLGRRGSAGAALHHKVASRPIQRIDCSRYDRRRGR